VPSCVSRGPFMLSMCTPENAFMHGLVTPCSIIRSQTSLYMTMLHHAPLSVLLYLPALYVPMIDYARTRSS
jgi:hypothetical protein